MPDVETVRTDAVIDSLIATLSDPGDILPAKAVKQARRHWEAFLPRLLDEMRAAIDVVRDDVEDPGDIAFWGLALIAERDLGEATQALPVLVEIASLSTEQIEMLIGELVHEMLPQALANVASDQVELLDGMFGDPALDVYARSAIGTAMIHLVAEGVLPREQVVQRLHRHLRRVLEQHRSGSYCDDEYYPTVIVNLLTDLLPHEALDDMFAAYAAGLVEEFSICEEDIQCRIDQGQAGLDEQLRYTRKRRVDDCLRILKHWGSFAQSSPPRTEFNDPLKEVTPGAAADTIQRRDAKVGRNAPCPCGSGRKYKKCCGQS